MLFLCLWQSSTLVTLENRVMPSPVSGLLGRSARLHPLCPPLWSLFFYLTAQLLALTYSHKCIHSIPRSQLHSFIRPSPTPSLTNTLTCSLFSHSFTVHSFIRPSLLPSLPPSLTNTLTCSPRSLFSHSFTLPNSFTHSAPLFPGSCIPGTGEHTISQKLISY